MPQGEKFWNPYRWVTVSDQPIEYYEPCYHHISSGLSGRLWCELEALTPLLIGDGNGKDGDGEVNFVRYPHAQQPYIPATSLKGALRSLAEVVGNAAVPFQNDSVDVRHRLNRARIDTAAGRQFDIVARTFGYLQDGNVFAGLIRFSDAEMIAKPTSPGEWPAYPVTVGQPKREHEAFYPGNNRRKFYHHHPGATGLVAPHPGIPPGSLRNRRPAPPGTRFSFTVDFANLSDAELDLLLYCLVLEEQVAVKLSQAALGRADNQASVILQGPLRHKIGGAKPHGAGSVHIRITKMQLRTDAMARYRGHDNVETWEEESTVMAELNRRTASFRGCTDLTMQELHAMLIYTTEDPRTPIHYPKYQWFQDANNLNTQLKPTI